MSRRDLLSGLLIFGVIFAPILAAGGYVIWRDFSLTPKSIVPFAAEVAVLGLWGLGALVYERRRRHSP